jgi:acetoin utilization deacetylase AcuC-like enzyme
MITLNEKPMMLSPVNRREFVADMGAVLVSAPLVLNPVIAAGANPLVGKKGTGYFYDPRCLSHPTVGGDAPTRLSTMHRRIQQSGILQEVLPVKSIISDGDINTAALRVHTREALDGLAVCTQTSAVALQAVAGVLTAVREVSAGSMKNAFCAIRPPGHHAHNNINKDGTCQGQGFCFLSNAAIAARYAKAVCGIKRVLIVDWDYHHGNGTQDAVDGDPDVLFFSTHNFHAYPGTGDPAYRGSGAGVGRIINVNLDCGAENDDICKAFDDRLLPAAESFKPGLVLISAGFDGKKNDSLGCFSVTARGFSLLTRKVMDIAQSYCSGRVVSMLEGGYTGVDPQNPYEELASCVEMHIKTLMTGTLQPEAACYSGTRQF